MRKCITVNGFYLFKNFRPRFPFKFLSSIDAVCTFKTASVSCHDSDVKPARAACCKSFTTPTVYDCKLVCV